MNKEVRPLTDGENVNFGFVSGVKAVALCALVRSALRRDD